MAIEIKDEEIREHFDVDGRQAIANLVFVLVCLGIERPNIFDLFRLMYYKNKL